MSATRLCQPDHGLGSNAINEGLCPDVLALTVNDSPDMVQPTTHDQMGRGRETNRPDSHGTPIHKNIEDLEMGACAHPVQMEHHQRSSPSAQPPPKHSTNGCSFSPPAPRAVPNGCTEADTAAGGRSPPAIPVSELLAAHRSLAALVNQYKSEPAQASLDVHNPLFKDSEQDVTFREAVAMSKTQYMHRSQTQALGPALQTLDVLPMPVKKISSSGVTVMDRRKMLLKQISPKDGEHQDASPGIYHSERAKKLRKQHSMLSMTHIVNDATTVISSLFLRATAGEQSKGDRKRIFAEAASHRADYDPKGWFLTLFRMHGRPQLGSAWWLVMTLASLHATLYHLKIVGGALPIAIHGLTGGALMFLIVLRTTGAFKKWSEGLKAWTNIAAACRELMQQCAAYCDDEVLVGTMHAHAVAFAVSVRCVLRQEDVEFSMLQGVMTDEEFRGLMMSNTPPLYCAHYIRHCIAQGVKDKSIAPVAMALEASLRILVNAYADCQRLVQPMPYIYVAHLRTFLLAYLIFLPAALLPLLGWHAIPTVAILSYALIGLENTAVQLEDPFGTDSNDLPLDEFIMDIQDYMMEVLDDRCVKDIYQAGKKGTQDQLMNSLAPQAVKTISQGTDKSPKDSSCCHKKKGACDGLAGAADGDAAEE